MARLRRLSVPAQPHQLLQRGINGAPIVRDDADREGFLAVLRTAATEHGVAIHAYCLLDEELQLLATPVAGDSLGHMMQALGRLYVSAFNRRHERSGPLWEGRFRASVVEAENWLLCCMRHVESSPVRAGQVARAEDHAWSSAPHHLGLRTDPLLTDHALYWSLGNTPFEREAAYRVFLAQPIPPQQQEEIRRACMRGWALGSAGFVAQIERESARSARPRPRGRPPVRKSVPI